jgi:carbon-monoxide dehydrogenase iron sulfur subunit
MVGKTIVVRKERCSGCQACSVACVFANEGRFGLAAARIRVEKCESRGLDEPIVCRQCAEPACVAACPSEALAHNESTGAIVCDTETCSGCGACVTACPYRAIHLHPQTGLALVCNLCDGAPACVTRCATAAIVFGSPDDEARPRWQRAELSRAPEGAP